MAYFKQRGICFLLFLSFRIFVPFLFSLSVASRFQDTWMRMKERTKDRGIHKQHFYHLPGLTLETSFPRARLKSKEKEAPPEGETLTGFSSEEPPGALALQHNRSQGAPAF